MARQLLCYAEGGKGGWEAICLDLDIAVQGESFDDVSRRLDEAIREYLKAADEEDEATRRSLLNRRAPLRVRVGYLLRFLRFWLTSGGSSGHSHHGYQVPCPV